MSLQTPASRLIHAELPSPAEMAVDCRAVGRNLRLERVARAAVATPPGITYADYPVEVRKRDIDISDATARLANALHLHLD